MKNKTLDRASLFHYIIENEQFIICPFLSTQRFISYCKERGIKTSKDHLEQLEKLGIFYPMLRIRRPKFKMKIAYSDDGTRKRDLGVLNEGEEWSGNIEERYGNFWFEKKYAKTWLEEGLLWEPSSRHFQEWKTFNDEHGYTIIENFYSKFQAYSLYHLNQSLKIELRAEWLVFHDGKRIQRLTKELSVWAKKRISFFQSHGVKEELVAYLCQIISNRYFPKTQSDHRVFRLSIPTDYDKWNWYEYCENWNGEIPLSVIAIDADELKSLHQSLSLTTQYMDPLERWYRLIRFVSVEKRDKLKGNALLAQLFYSMEEMLRMFYEELTNTKLYLPDESPTWKKDDFYGEGVTEDELEYLEYLANEYRLNPKPRLILVVEGDGEEEHVPRLAIKLFGYSFPRLAIEIVNIKGIGGFTGKKGLDRYGALEKFIDDYHRRQTIVFVVLDNEGRVPQIKERLIQAQSKYYKRTVTKKEYFHIWNSSIEFDNFNDDEIARAMTTLSGDRYTFHATEIRECRNRFTNKESNPLGKLFNEKLNYDLNKPDLLELLFGFIISNAENEFDNNGEAKRPIVQIIRKVRELAAQNLQPVNQSIKTKNQESGFFGNPLIS